jgi:hypothetical protein
MARGQKRHSNEWLYDLNVLAHAEKPRHDLKCPWDAVRSGQV